MDLFVTEQTTAMWPAARPKSSATRTIFAIIFACTPQLEDGPRFSQVVSAAAASPKLRVCGTAKNGDETKKVLYTDENVHGQNEGVCAGLRAGARAGETNMGVLTAGPRLG